MIKEPKLICTF